VTVMSNMGSENECKTEKDKQDKPNENTNFPDFPYCPIIRCESPRNEQIQ